MEIMNKREFKRLVDRLIDEWIESADKNGDGAISRKEFYDNFYSVYGWQGSLLLATRRCRQINFRQPRVQCTFLHHKYSLLLAWLAKKHINKTFDQALKFADSDGDELMSKEEVCLLSHSTHQHEIKIVFL